jgi:protein SCO1/2
MENLFYNWSCGCAITAALVFLMGAVEPGASSDSEAIPSYRRSEVSYRAPDVGLVDRNSSKVRLREVLDAEGPVAIQFIFTSCPTICPLLTGGFAAAQKELSPDELKKLRFVSISIDPEYDTPARLAAYATQFGAGKEWRFLTGDRADIVTIQKAFRVYEANKMWHDPVTVLRLPGGGKWIRIDGTPSAAELAGECRLLLKP